MRPGFDETRVGQLAIVVTELATNIVKHAQHGEILVAECDRGAARGVEVLALDKGRGMRDVGQSMRDGHSTAGSLGQGLGAVRRMADAFDVFSQPAKGTAALARLWAGRDHASAAGAFALGAVSAWPRTGEESLRRRLGGERRTRSGVVMVADGLGHGVLAAEAAAAAVAAFERDPFRPPKAMLERRPSRAARDPRRRRRDRRDRLRKQQVQFAGLGNISGAIVDGTGEAQHGVAQRHRRPHRAHPAGVHVSDGERRRSW